MKYHDRIKKQGEYEFSYEPKSFWEYKRGGNLDVLVRDSKSYGETYTGKVPIHKGRYNDGGFLSKFNSEYAKRILEMWSKEGDLVLDPFCGRSSRPIISTLMKRNYFGFDVLEDNLEEARTQHKTFVSDGDFELGKMKLVHSSSEFVDDHISRDDVADFVFTCPPYFNIERYESADGQLTDIKSYDNFLEVYSRILENTSSKLKPGGFFVVVVANFRMDNKFYDFSGDTKSILKGFLDYHDEVILEMSPAKRHPLYLQAITNLNCLKTHEYCLVFRKAASDKQKTIERNNEINWSRPLVKDIYPKEERLFWSEDKGKKDWLDDLFNKTGDTLEDFFG